METFSLSGTGSAKTRTGKGVQSWVFSKFLSNNSRPNWSGSHRLLRGHMTPNLSCFPPSYELSAVCKIYDIRAN